MRKIVSIVIVMAMMLCMLPAAFIMASATATDFVQDANPSTYADGATYVKDGVEYTVIKSSSTFTNIKNNLSGNYILGGNINLNKTITSPLWGASSAFTGVLDGNGYAVTGLTMNYTGGYAGFAMFARKLKSNAKILNLSLGTAEAPLSFSVTKYTGQSPNIGVISAEAEDSTAKIEISGVDVYCNISYQVATTSTVKVGGFIGKNQGATVNVSDSSFTGSILFTESADNTGNGTRAGGLIGTVDSGNVTVTDFTNNADIDISYRAGDPENNNYACVGGLIGDNLSGVSLTNCINNGSLNSDGFTGGMIGRCRYQASFTNCVNSGDITSRQVVTDMTAFAGGIVGSSYFTSSNTYVFEYTNCVNHGNVSVYSDVNSTEKASAGGIIGVTEMTTQKLINCGNTGNISATRVYSKNETPKLGACGIIGRYYINNSDTVIDNCYSTGTISSNLANDDREYSVYAICTGQSNKAATKMTISNCVWNMTFNGEPIANGPQTSSLTENSGNNEQKNILAKTSTKTYDAFKQRSADNTMLRILLVSETPTLSEETELIIVVHYGDNQRKRFTVDASDIFALESVQAAGETYYAVDGMYIFGAVITGIPENLTITDIDVKYGDFIWA